MKAQLLGQFRRLIEAALAQTLGMQGHRHNAVVVLMGQCPQQLPGEPGRQSQFATVFIGVNQLVERKVINKRCENGIEMWGAFQAVATNLRVFRAIGAARTSLRQDGDVGAAGRAKNFLAVAAAQQAGMRQAKIQPAT